MLGICITQQSKNVFLGILNDFNWTILVSYWTWATFFDKLLAPQNSYGPEIVGFSNQLFLWKKKMK